MRRVERVCVDSTNLRERRIDSRMSYEVIKTIRGRRYKYRQETYREGGKVKTRSVYIGPVDGPKRRRKGISVGDIFRALFEVGGYVAVKGTKRPSYKTKNRPPDPRSMKHMLDEARQKWERQIDDAKMGYGKQKAKVQPNAEWQEFMDRIAARQTAQDASGRTEGPQAKDFTVDDEIEAREAKFEAAVDEYNEGTTAAPDAPAPDDAPSQF